MSFFTGLKEKLNSLAADYAAIEKPRKWVKPAIRLYQCAPARCYSSCRFICVPPMDLIGKSLVLVFPEQLPNVSIDYDALYRIGIGGFFAEFSLSGVCKNLP